jgi:hypothetical protein
VGNSFIISNSPSLESSPLGAAFREAMYKDMTIFMSWIGILLWGVAIGPSDKETV